MQNVISKAVGFQILFTLLSWCLLADAQALKPAAPSGLLCDLVAFPNCKSLNGYLINFEVGLNDEPVQRVRISNKQPVFSWMLNDLHPNASQTAYQLLLAEIPTRGTNGGKDVWDTGKILSNRSAGVTITATIKPNTTYSWKVRIWNDHGELSPYSVAQTFYTDSVLADHRPPAYPLQITEERPLSINKQSDVFLVDFARDAFGQLKLSLFSAKGEDTVTIRLGEALGQDGRINRKPAGSIYYAQYHLNLQKGWHTYKLRLKSNAYNTRPAAIKMPAEIGEVAPFRYCEIENYSTPLQGAHLTRLAVHYPFDDTAANFHCAEKALEQVWELCKYSVKATSFSGLYVDGNRERTPYEADALINQLSHYAVDKEFTLARNSHEYLITHPTWPTEWILQSVLIAWNDYLYTGDISSAKYYYEDLKAKTLTSLADETNLISTKNGRMTPEVLKAVHFETGPLKDIVDWPRASETDGFVFTKYNAVVNAFYYRALVIMQKLAADLGETSDSKFYGEKATAVKKAFQTMFYDQARKIYVDGDSTKHASLHANAFALALGLVDKAKAQAVVDFIVSRGMACSVYGSQFLLEGLYNAGKADYALALMTSKGDRSWLHMLDQGSTITMEAWDGRFKPNQDWNHAWGAAPANIISRKLMGIEPLAPGWSHFQIKPQIAGLSYANIDVPTIKGTIKILYRQTLNTFNLNAEIPANTLADIHIPKREKRKISVQIDGHAAKLSRDNQDMFLKNVGSGRHIIEITYTN